MLSWEGVLRCISPPVLFAGFCCLTPCLPMDSYLPHPLCPPLLKERGRYKERGASPLLDSPLGENELHSFTFGGVGK